MALLTIPSELLKGEPLQFSLNTLDLVDLITKIYYKDQTNWRKVMVVYHSLVDNQLIGITFFPNGNVTLNSTVVVAFTARNVFELAFITVYDEQDGYDIVPRESIPNVNDYTLIFPPAGDAFFSIENTSAGQNAKMGLAPDSIYASYFNEALYDSPAKFQLVSSAVTGETSGLLSLRVNNWKTQYYKISDDKTKAWAIGRYGTSYLGKTLPAVSSGPNYTGNPPRAIEIDITTGNVTWLCDLQEFSGGIPTGFGDFICDILVDTVNSVIVIASSALGGSGGYAGYDFSNNLLWYNATTQSAFGFLKLIPFDTNYTLTLTSQYGVTTYPDRALLKLNNLTGVLDPVAAFPTISGADANEIAWGLTPDKSKVFITYFTGTNYLVSWDSATNTWSAPVNTGLGNNAFTSMVVTQNYLYVQYQFTNTLRKYTHAMTAVGGFSTSSALAHTPIMGDDTDLYFWSSTGTLTRANAVTGASNVLFKGPFNQQAPVLRLTQYLPGVVSMVSTAYSNVISCFYLGTAPSLKLSQSLARIDKTTGDLINARTTPSGVSFDQTPVLAEALLTSPSYPGKVFGKRFTTGAILCYNTNTWSQESGWPVFATNTVQSVAIIDNYIYVVRFANTGSTWSVTDGSGSFTMNSVIVRINLATKLVDQTYDPVFATNFTAGSGRGVFITSSDQYIYVTSNRGSDPVSGQVFRVSKTTNLLEFILPTDLGLTGDWDGGRIMVYQTAANEVIFVQDFPITNGFGIPNFQFNGKSYYRISDEDNLTPDGTQPTTTDIFQYVVYNSTLDEIAGTARVNIGGAAGQLFMAKYGVTANTETHIINMTVDRYISGASINPNYILAIMPDGDDYYMLTNFVVLINNKGYNGVIRMNPFGVPNNDL